MGGDPLACPLPVLKLLFGPSPMDFICFSSAECVRKFFSCFEFEEMPLQENSCSILFFCLLFFLTLEVKIALFLILN